MDVTSLQITPILAVCVVALVAVAASDPADAANYDESKVPKYTLPDPLVLADGTRVADAETWRTKRRPEVLELFRVHVYGRSPARPKGMTFKVLDTDRKALGGKATRKQVTVYFTGKEDGPSMDILLYLPNAAKGPVPTFLTLNFQGNHSIHPDPKIKLAASWLPSGRKGVANNRATEAARGLAKSRWAIDKILARGYGLATIYYGDIDPDHHDGFKNGIHPIFDKGKRSADSWGSIAAWAWGLSRGLDYLETDKAVDPKRVIVMGHSRLGKTSLWAGAQDERFAITISNDSGCGGAALSRRAVGETVARINKSFPHWFCINHRKYDSNEGACPVDHHMLIALMAPRAVYVASAQGDRWADPRGEFLSCKHAAPVWRLFGKEGMPDAQQMPGTNRPVHSGIGYHIRTGKHDVTDYDWERYMDFADKHFARKAK